MKFETGLETFGLRMNFMLVILILVNWFYDYIKYDSSTMISFSWIYVVLIYFVGLDSYNQRCNAKKIME